MQIETLKVDDINPAVYNPRKDLKPGDPDYDKLKKSILEFDMVEPLIWNKTTGNLVGGHQRLKVLKELGVKNVEVSVVNLSEVKEKALNLALNKISGEWDMPMLKDLLQELDTGAFDMEITGFDDKEIEDLMNQLFVPESGNTDDDAVPEPTESICRRRDLWSLGNHRLLCGDATVKADVERLIGGEKADMVFTDPPYGIDLETDYSKLPEREVKGKKYPKVIGDNKDFNYSDFHWLNCTEQIWWGADYYCQQLPQEGSWFVWEKRTEAASNMIGNEFELCWSKAKHRKEVIRILWAGYTARERNETRVHPTQKPVALAEWFIGKFSQLSNIILDPFGGSGSTLIACEKLNRRCYMMEIDEHYCDVIIERWQQFTGKKAELVPS